MSVAGELAGLRRPLVGRTIEAAVERQRSAGHTEWLEVGALPVVLCGTGSPLPHPTSAAGALQTARDAGVDMLVMTHLVPPPPGRLRSWLFTRGLEGGDVEIVLGEDGMHFRLPADSETIEHETLGS